MPNQNLRNQKHGIGLLAQLVQSIWFTPRGSGVRIPQGPQTPQEIEEFFLCVEINFHQKFTYREITHFYSNAKL